MTKILITILAWLLIVNGVLFLIWPEKARQGLLKQGYKIFRWQLLLLAVFLAMAAFSFGGKTETAMLRNLSLAGVVVVVWLFFVLKQKAYEKLTAYFAKASVAHLRFFSAAQIVVGVLMLVFKRKII